MGIFFGATGFSVSEVETWRKNTAAFFGGGVGNGRVCTVGAFDAFVNRFLRAPCAPWLLRAGCPRTNQEKDQ